MNFEVSESKKFPSDNSLVYFNPSELNSKILKGDCLTIFGKNKQTVAIARADETVPKGCIQMNKVVKKNLCVHIGDLVEVKLLPVNFGKQIKVLPVEETIHPFEEIIPELLKSYFEDSYRPVMKGDVFTVPTDFHGRVVEFQILDIQGSNACIVSPDTMINSKGSPVKRRVLDVKKREKNSIGGYHEQISELTSTIKNGTKSILLFGHEGCGKKHIIQVLSKKMNLNLKIIHANELITSEKVLLEAIKDCESKENSILFIDHFDEIKDKETISKYYQLIKKNLNQSILVESSRVYLKNEEFQFDKILEFKVPTSSERLDILQILTEDLYFDESVDLNQISKQICGFLACDIFNLIQYLLKMERGDKEIYYNIDNFYHSLSEISPSILSEYPKKSSISLSDFGCSLEFKNDCISKLLNSLRNIEESKDGNCLHRGYLFYGPSSTGKTMLANALSNETCCCFVSISGSKIDDSKITQAFKMAMDVSPSVLFIDDLDQISNSMDLILENIKQCQYQVLVITASNSIEFSKDMIDLLNPIEFKLPNEESRIAILRASLRKSCVQKNFPWERTSIQMEGLNGKEISSICQNAVELSLKEAEKNNLMLEEEDSAEYFAMVTWNHFLNCENFNPQVLDENLYE
jgi:transitional endoplasmic reticulum ATPase